MHFATVTCTARNGALIKVYRIPYPESSDIGRVARPSQAYLEAETKERLLSEGLAVPSDWGNIKFVIQYSA
jgi:hypothetical protein